MNDVESFIQLKYYPLSENFRPEDFPTEFQVELCKRLYESMSTEDTQLDYLSEYQQDVSEYILLSRISLYRRICDQSGDITRQLLIEYHTNE